MEDLLRREWLARRPKVLDDVESLCAVLRVGHDAAGADAAVARAEWEAHRLAGVLGFFGQRELGRMAAALERELAPSAAGGGAPDRLARAAVLGAEIQRRLHEDAAAA